MDVSPTAQVRSCLMGIMMLHVLIGLAASVPTSTGAAAASSGSSGSTTNSTSLFTNVTLIAAVIAASAATLAAFLQRKTGKDAAAASRTAAAAAERSANAAEAAVRLNAENATAAGRRSDAESLSKRYQDAAAQLGHDKAAVRLAGVYALARLADDWPDQRQTCIDLLCAYLRMPVGTTASEAVDVHDLQVRMSVQRTIAHHLMPDATVSWSDLEFDFGGAVFSDLNLYGAVFQHRPDFNGATFRGFSSLGATFSSGLAMTAARVEGELSLSPKKFGGLMSMDKLVIASGAKMTFHYTSLGPGQLLTMNAMRIAGRLDGTIVAPATDGELLHISADDVCVEGGYVDLRVGIRGLNDNPFLFARGWTATHPQRIYVESAAGAGDPPGPYANAVFNLNGSAVAGDGASG
ncbi:hypothetical protein [Nocardioides sp. KR10-350]|uniref:hypothetical protein n=1 Tax=Nocardioides cheoyonin TaxID=3156615 RepID=UPI0032B42396